jgi:hypothetical protein
VYHDAIPTEAAVLRDTAILEKFGGNHAMPCSTGRTGLGQASPEAHSLEGP